MGTQQPDTAIDKCSRRYFSLFPRILSYVKRVTCAASCATNPYCCYTNLWHFNEMDEGCVVAIFLTHFLGFVEFYIYLGWRMQLMTTLHSCKNHFRHLIFIIWCHISNYIKIRTLPTNERKLAYFVALEFFTWRRTGV